jgi:hypothetical protein
MFLVHLSLGFLSDLKFCCDSNSNQNGVTLADYQNWIDYVSEAEPQIYFDQATKGKILNTRVRSSEFDSPYKKQHRYRHGRPP